MKALLLCMLLLSCVTVYQRTDAVKPVLIVGNSMARIVFRKKFPDDIFDPTFVKKGPQKVRAWDPKTVKELKFPPDTFPGRKKPKE